MILNIISAELVSHMELEWLYIFSVEWILATSDQMQLNITIPPGVSPLASTQINIYINLLHSRTLLS